MAKMDLLLIGRLLGLLSGFIIIVNGALRIFDNGFGPFDFLGQFGGVVSGIVAILAGIVMIIIYLEKVKIKDVLLLGVVYIALGLISSCVTAIFAGIVIILHKLIK
jgi:hypothetical protein